MCCGLAGAAPFSLRRAGEEAWGGEEDDPPEAIQFHKGHKEVGPGDDEPPLHQGLSPLQEVASSAERHRSAVRRWLSGPALPLAVGALAGSLLLLGIRRRCA